MDAFLPQGKKLTAHATVTRAATGIVEEYDFAPDGTPILVSRRLPRADAPVSARSKGHGGCKD